MHERDLWILLSELVKAHGIQRLHHGTAAHNVVPVTLGWLLGIEIIEVEIGMLLTGAEDRDDAGVVRRSLQEREES